MLKFRQTVVLHSDFLNPLLTDLTTHPSESCQASTCVMIDSIYTGSSIEARYRRTIVDNYKKTHTHLLMIIYIFFLLFYMCAFFTHQYSGAGMLSDFAYFGRSDHV